jgi:hypothetical protein
MLNNTKIEKAINKNFLRPLKEGNSKNIVKLNNHNNIYPNETVNLLTQTYYTLSNVHKLMKNNELVDANILLRSSFENLVMAMMIHFDKDTYNEFKDLKTTDGNRNKTKISTLRNEFRKYLKQICTDLFDDVSKKDIKKILDELYDKLCLFTHSTLIVSTMNEIKKNKDDQVLILLSYQNVYFIEILLFYCLIYFTHDKSHFLKSENITISWLLYIAITAQKFKESNIDYKKYNEFLYYESNTQFFKKQKNDIEKFKNETTELENEIKENDKFRQSLIEFMK